MKNIFLSILIAGSCVSCSAINPNKGITQWQKPVENSYMRDRYQEPIFNKHLKISKEEKQAS